MKFKLDENFGTRTQQIFRVAGHEVETVRDEGLSGAADEQIYDVCCVEGFCLVTLDLEFSNVIRFSPELANGIAVIRVSQNPSLATLEKLVKQFLSALERDSIEKHLWIIEVGKIHVHQAELNE